MKKHIHINYSILVEIIIRILLVFFILPSNCITSVLFVFTLHFSYFLEFSFYFFFFRSVVGQEIYGPSFGFYLNVKILFISLFDQHLINSNIIVCIEIYVKKFSRLKINKLVLYSIHL